MLRRPGLPEDRAAEGATPIAPGPLTSTICVTPSMVDKCGELYPHPSVGPNQRGFPVARS